jgi:hypothetical protein
VLRQRDHHDHRELDAPHEIAGARMKVSTKMRMDGQSLVDPMMDARSMVFLKMDVKKVDHLMVALDDRY